MARLILQLDPEAADVDVDDLGVGAACPLQTSFKICPRSMASPWRRISSSTIWYSTWVSGTGRPSLYRVRLRVFSRKGPLSTSTSRGADAASWTRRQTASTRATSSEGEKGLVT